LSPQFRIRAPKQYEGCRRSPIQHLPFLRRMRVMFSQFCNCGEFCYLKSHPPVFLSQVAAYLCRSLFRQQPSLFTSLPQDEPRAPASFFEPPPFPFRFSFFLIWHTHFFFPVFLTALRQPSSFDQRTFPFSIKRPSVCWFFPVAVRFFVVLNCSDRSVP